MKGDAQNIALTAFAILTHQQRHYIQGIRKHACHYFYQRSFGISGRGIWEHWLSSRVDTFHWRGVIWGCWWCHRFFLPRQGRPRKRRGGWKRDAQASWMGEEWKGEEDEEYWLFEGLTRSYIPDQPTRILAPSSPCPLHHPEAVVRNLVEGRGLIRACADIRLHNPRKHQIHKDSLAELKEKMGARARVTITPFYSALDNFPAWSARHKMSWMSHVRWLVGFRFPSGWLRRWYWQWLSNYDT